MQDFVRLSGIGFAFRIVTILLLCFHIVRGSWAFPVAGVSPAISSLACQAVALAKAGHPPLITSGKLLPSYFFETCSPSGLLAPTLVTNASPARTLLCRASRALHCISAAPAALDRYLAALPAMSLIPFAPLKLARLPAHSSLPSRLCLLRRCSRQLRSLSCVPLMMLPYGASKRKTLNR